MDRNDAALQGQSAGSTLVLSLEFIAIYVLVPVVLVLNCS